MATPIDCLRMTSENKKGKHVIKLKINPVSITENVAISYGSDTEGTPNPGGNQTSGNQTSGNQTGGNQTGGNQTVGNKGNQKEPAYKKHNFGNISFKITLYDKLGLSYNGKVIDNVESQIQKLKKTIYHYVKDDHKQPCVQIAWGNKLYERCYISDIGINYTLFDKKGKILRADIDLKFILGLDPETEKEMKSPNSPDMSRIRVLNDEDKLSLMCAEFYGDSTMQMQVAKENGIINFRKLKPGTEVYFPPIKK